MIDKKLFENDELVGKARIIHDVYLSENKEYNILEDRYFTDITAAKLVIDYSHQPTRLKTSRLGWSED